MKEIGIATFGEAKKFNKITFIFLHILCLVGMSNCCFRCSEKAYEFGIKNSKYSRNMKLDILINSTGNRKNLNGATTKALELPR